MSGVRDLLRMRVILPLTLTMASGGGALAALVAGFEAPAVASLAGLTTIFASVTLGSAAHILAPGEPDEEPREHKGPGLRRRQLLMRAGAGSAVVIATAVAFPAVRRLGEATEALRGTAWSAGARVVDPDGTPIRIDDVRDGEMLTVYPEGATDAAEAQAVLIREPPERFSADPERADWVADGVAVYSKLCTHMACPLGLYQQQSGTLLCPCHQAVFDVLDGGRALQGPARRALPQLPVTVDRDGFLVAAGGFSDAVGTGFWGRP